jgi:gamma-glutamyl:cysteine ligase YbdK (ATP-grasp superfamily)
MFTLPATGTKVEFKLLNDKDNEIIDQENESMKRFNKDSSSEITIRLKHQIVSVEGDNDKNSIRMFVEQMLAQDSRALRKYIKDMAPDVNLSADVDINGVEESIDVPISLSFFWPDL